jgi:hypothetical protein
MSLPVDGEREQMGTAPVGDPSLILDELDEMQEVDLSSLLDLQDKREDHESKRTGRVLLLSCGCLFILIAFCCLVTASNRRAFEGLVRNLEESRRDMDPVGISKPPANPFDDVLQKLGSRSIDVDNATRSLGTDPSTVKEDGMDAEMKQMMGGEGRTSGERQRAVQGLAHLAGVELQKPTGSGNEVAEPKVPKAPKTPEESDR